MSNKAVYWAELPLRRESHRMAGIINPMYEAALKKDYTQEIYDELKIIARSKLNLIMSWFGLQGSGKSFSLLDVVMTYLSFFQPEKELSIDNCFFTLTELLNKVAEIDKGEVIILDEQIHTTGYGSKIEKKALENIEMTVRAHRLSLFFAAPKHISHNYHYFVETWQMGSTAKWDWNIPIEKQWLYTKNIIYSEKGHMLGYFVTTTPKDMGFVKAYEKKKDSFIYDVKGMRGGKRHEFIMGLGNKLLEQKGFIDKYSVVKTKRLKQLLVNYYLKGPMLTIEEWKTLIDWIDFKITFNEKEL